MRKYSNDYHLTVACIDLGSRKYSQCIKFTEVINENEVISKNYYKDIKHSQDSIIVMST